MHELLAKFDRIAYFVTVYIVEAHAIDEWPVGDPLKITQPLTTAERVGVARAFVQEYNFQIPLLVDTIENSFSETFAAWPIRFFIVQNGKIIFKAQPDGMSTYDSSPKELFSVLDSFQTEMAA